MTDDHDKHMNELCMRVSLLFNGEDMFDVACVCMMVASFTLRGIEPFELRQRALEQVIEFLQEQTLS